MEQTLNDVAVIGIACRYPGEAKDPNGFLSMLQNGRAAWSKIPAERFDIDAYHHPSHDRQGSVSAQGGHFIEQDVATFDAPFFSITAAEARAMDPQQRMLLEVAYEVFESAGVPMHKMAGTDTSVYVGCFTRDYEAVSSRQIDDTLLYQATGQGFAMQSNRLSWFYDLKGPSLTLDTACSSSLLALHLACQSIRNGESKMSIVGGTGLMLSPDIMRLLTSLHFLSPDSRCYSFDDRANGYARGEGIAALLLKPVEDAIRDGDVIRAVIRGTGSNQDGRTPGITLPSSEAQAALITTTYRNANLPFEDTQYFEAHGTGTPAGDPLELGALGTTFGSPSSSPRSHPLYVGSVKTNIGHLEGGAGLAGVIKAILSVESGYIFPSLNFEKPNPRLRLSKWGLQIPTTLTSWPTKGTRRASVNSFGYGGSNVHAIIDDAYHYLQKRGLRGFTNTNPRNPELERVSENGIDSGFDSGTSSDPEDPSNDSVPSTKRSKKLFVLSSPDQASLKRLGTSYANFVANRRESKEQLDFLDNLAYTLGCRRSIHSWRQMAVASSAKDVSTALKNASPIRSKKGVQLAFIFTGQGAQWYAMGRELMSHEVYARSVRSADAYLESLGATWSVVQELSAIEAESKINDAEFSQPLCTVVQVALMDLLSHWGVKPKAVAGHSSGEIAAAYAAGILSAEDAWKVAFQRGCAVSQIRHVAPQLSGGMTAAGLSEVDAQTYLDKLNTSSNTVVACINSGESVTISGDTSDLDALEARLKADGVFSRRLKVTNAYHSPHMNYVADAYKTSISDIQPRAGNSECTFYSSVTGALAQGSTLDADYWVANMTRPVKFLQAVKNMFPEPSTTRRRRQRGSVSIDTLVEVGPAGALQAPLRNIVSSETNAAEITLLTMLARNKDATETSLAVAGTLWTLGYPELNLTKVNDTASAPRAKMVICETPIYPWNHSTKYWHEPQRSWNRRFPKAPRLDLLGFPSEDWNPSQPSWRHRLRISELPWIKEHMVQGSIIFPAAGYICAVLEGAQQIADDSKTTKQFELRDILIGRALEIDGDSDIVELITSFKPRKLGLKSKDAPWIEWTIFSNGQHGHIEHCSGLLYTHYELEVSQIEQGREEQLYNQRLAEEYRTSLARSTKTVVSTDMYAKLDGIGLHYGPLFQGITAVQQGNVGVGCTTIEITDTKSAMPAQFEYDHLLHPCTLDACIQSVFATITLDAGQKLQAMVPTSIETVKVAARLLKGAGAKYHGYATAEKKQSREVVGTVRMSDQAWSAPLIEIEKISCTELGALTGGQAAGSGTTAALRKMQSYWHWDAHLSLLSPEAAERLIGTPQAELKAYKETLPDAGEKLEKLAAIFGQRALKALTDEEEKNLAPHLVLYVQWLREQNKLALQGSLPLQKDGDSSWVTMTYEEEEEFIDHASKLGIDATLLIAIGRDLNGILNGTVPPLSVMMRDDMLFSYYANAFVLEFSNLQVAKACALVGHQKPSMKVLELGGGTASITVPILQALDSHHKSTIRCGGYVFTDISSGFFEAAEKKLKQWSNVVSYKRLDIEQDPIEQGFAKESFDLIVATNVLHATRNMDRTMENVMKLLKPDGHIVLGEITYPRARVAAIMGTLSGWWLSEDGRKGGPCMSDEQWIDVFERNGLHFNFALSTTPGEDTRYMSTLCATKPSIPSLSFTKTVILDNGKPSPQLDILADNIANSLHSQGFETSRLHIADFEQKAQATDGAHSSKNVVVVSLLEAEVPFLRTLNEIDFEAVKGMLLNTAGTLWVTRSDSLGACDPDFRMVDGLLRVVRNEDQSLHLHSLDLKKSMDLPSDAARQSVVTVFKEVFLTDKTVAETEFVYKDGMFMIPRLYDDCAKNHDLLMHGDVYPPTIQPWKQEGRPLRMTIGVPGMLDTLHFVDDEVAALPLPPDHVEYAVQATALNFVDVMVAMGYINDTEMGCDAAGIITRVGSQVSTFKPGDRVACMTFGAYRNVIRSPEKLVQKIPDDMSFGDAASLMVVHITAYQSLVEIARLQPGETILIHAAAGGLGQAAIQLAQYIGAKIFVTVGSTSKKELIMETYGIPEDHIFNSRDLTFADAVLRSTNNLGVDVVINSLAGEALRKTWTCIKDFGRFIELGKKDILANTGLEMMPFLRNVIFAGVNLEHIFRVSKDHLAKITSQVFDLVRAGHLSVVKPTTVFSIDEVEKAFRMMQQGKHTGKIVLTMNDENSKIMAAPHDRHPLRLRSNGTYLLVGGLGGLGRAQALWLAENGARHLAFMSRSGAASDAAKQTLQRLEEMGVDARAYACDTADKDTLVKTLATMADEMPRIYGVIQGAMVLADTIFNNMTFEKWTKATRPKVLGSYNLHELLPADMDFFIMLSSISGVCGSRGQANYAAGNTFQDALAHHRRARGLPATVLDLGMMAGFGYVEENKDSLGGAMQNTAEQLRSLFVEPHEFYSTLKSSITGYTDMDGSRMPVQAGIGLGTGGMVRAAKIEGDWYMLDDFKTSYLAHIDTLDASVATDESANQFRVALAATTSLAAAAEVVQEALIAKLAKAMMMPPGDIDITKPISSYGVDSLVAVEVRNWVSREAKSELSVFDILSPVAMSVLIHKIASKSSVLSAEVKAEVGAEDGAEPSDAAAKAD